MLPHARTDGDFRHEGRRARPGRSVFGPRRGWPSALPSAFVYRTPAVLEPAARTDAVASVSRRIDALRAELEDGQRTAERAQRRAEAVLREADALVTRAEEARRRVLLRALASAPDTAQADRLRAALRAERRERDLRAALTRASAGPLDADTAAPAAPGAELDADAAPSDVHRTREALARAREARARHLAPALAAAREAETLVRDLERSLDALERERERLARMGER